MFPIFLRVPILHVRAITFWFVVLWKYVYDAHGERHGLEEDLVNHETIHYYQWGETWVLGFLVLYLWDFLKAWRRMSFWDAYRRIRFEQEAFEHEKDLEYLNDRNKNAWREYEV